MNKNEFIKVNISLKSLNIDPLAIAKYFTKKGVFSHLIIQKLVYFAFLEGLKNNLLFFKERFQAWKYGPVLRSIFDEISNNDTYDNIFSQAQMIVEEEVVSLLDKVWEEYGHQEAWELVTKSHQGPWEKTRNKLGIDEGEICTAEIELTDLVKFANDEK